MPQSCLQMLRRAEAGCSLVSAWQSIFFGGGASDTEQLKEIIKNTIIFEYIIILYKLIEYNIIIKYSNINIVFPFVFFELRSLSLSS